MGQTTINSEDQVFTIKNAIDHLSKIYNKSSIIQSLALELGVSERTMYYYINDPEGMPAGKFIRLCLILEVAPDQCLNLENYSMDIQSVIGNLIHG